jgi:hypothetical protein
MSPHVVGDGGVGLSFRQSCQAEGR